MCNLTTFENVKREDVIDVLSNAKPELDFLDACLLYQVCPRPFISMESVHFVEVFRACDGFARVNSPADFYDLPALYIRVTGIIEDELMKITAEKKGNK